jgi:hypothetical protein
MRAVFVATLLAACSSSSNTPDAAVDPADLDAAEGCAACEPPASSTTACVGGTVIDSSTNQPVNEMRVRIYDPVAFSSNPNTQPLATVMSDTTGRFTAHAVMRPGSALIEIVVDGNGYMTAMQGQQLHASQNVCVTVAVHR